MRGEGCKPGFMTTPRMISRGKVISKCLNWVVILVLNLQELKLNGNENV